MSVKLIPGFSGQIEITGQNGSPLFKKEISSQEQLSNFLNKYSHSREREDFRGAFYPLNTGSLELLARDVFLPTFINSALKINNLALKIIASVFAILFDVITLPIRLFTTPFKIYHDRGNPETPHPLSQWLEKKGIQRISDTSVTIHYSTEEVGIEDKKDNDGCVNQYGHKKNQVGSISVALSASHPHKCQKKEEGTNTHYKNINGDWVFLATTTGRVQSPN